jgi:hypothetical protein
MSVEFGFFAPSLRASFRKLVLQLVLKGDEVAACLYCSSEVKRGRKPDTDWIDPEQEIEGADSGMGS